MTQLHPFYQTSTNSNNFGRIMGMVVLLSKIDFYTDKIQVVLKGSYSCLLLTGVTPGGLRIARN